MTGGPGRSKRGSLTTDFDLGEDEGFGEQTAAVWSRSGQVALQHNHRGPRPASIRRYLSSFLREGGELDLVPHIDPDVWARFQGSHSHLGVECTVDTRTLTPEMASNNIALEHALKMRQETYSGKVHLKLSYGEDKTGGPMQIFDFVRGLFQNREVVDSLKVKVREMEGDPVEVLNIFNHQEMDEIDDASLQLTSARRFTTESR